MNPDYFPECCSGGHRWSQNATILKRVCTRRFSMVYGCGNVSRPLLKAATHHRYIVINMCSNSSICPSSFQQAYYATPFKWLKVLNRSTYSPKGYGCTLEWMLQTPFTSQSTTVTGLLSAISSPMTVTNESLTLQPLSIHILYPGANEHSPWGCCIFSAVYMPLEIPRNLIGLQLNEKRQLLFMLMSICLRKFTNREGKIQKPS